MAEQKNVRKIKASKELQMKVGTGVINEKHVNAAQKVMDENEVDFKVIAMPELNALQLAIDSAGKDLSDADAVMQTLKTPIMNLKANAAVFKYGLVSELTGMVLLLFENVIKPDKKLVQIADILHKTILLTLAYGMTGDGGANGRVLVQAFEQVCNKYKPVK